MAEKRVRSQFSQQSQKKARLAVVIGATLAGCGLIYVALTSAMIGVAEGLLAAAHDPGKVLFHVVILPLAVEAIVFHFPDEVVKKAWSGSPAVVSGLGVLAFVITIGFSIDEARAGFCERLAMPADIRNESTRKNLQKLHETLRQKMAALRAEPTQPGQEAQTSQRLQKTSLEAKEEYRTALDKTRTTGCHYLEQASWRATWGAFLTFLGVAFVSFIAWLLCVHLWILKPPDDSTRQSLLVAVLLLTLWFFTRAYSEWYHNFGAPISYKPFTPVLIFTVVALLILALLHRRHQVLVISGTSIGVVSVIVSVIAIVKPEWFSELAWRFFSLSAFQLGFIYTVVPLFIVMGVRFALLASHQP